MNEFTRLLILFTLSRKCSANWYRAVIEFIAEKEL